jgi:predicted NAD/FAD-binding protein
MLYEADGRLGGHANTVDIGTPGNPVPVDAGFIVYNETTYPNLTALFDYLDVPTVPSRMTFSVSLDDGLYEYSGSGLQGIFGQPANLFSPSHWQLVMGIVRFFKTAPAQVKSLAKDTSLGEFLRVAGYSQAFIERHLLPMAGAIWSANPNEMLAYPAHGFLRFFDNHGLLKIANRPQWRTVQGGSREYISRLVADSRFGIVHRGVDSIFRLPDGVLVGDDSGERKLFDHVVIATHANQAFAFLSDADYPEAELLSAFRYSQNKAILHTDTALMPKRRKLWSSWNYLAKRDHWHKSSALSYWMNSLQHLATEQDVFVTLNPAKSPPAETLIRSFNYEHPVFSAHAVEAQEALWSIQGRRRTWFCGAYFGAGFHEDGLQSGLAVAEQLGGVRRPWRVENESGRIHVGSPPRPQHPPFQEAAE